MGLGSDRWISPASSLKLLAAREKGLTEFGDDPFAENLVRLIDALNGDGELSEAGKALTEGEILRHLRNRLEIRTYLSHHPEILSSPVPAPIFVMGLPRSGTTFLHNLLALDEGLRHLKTWETLHPCPPPAVDRASIAARIAAATQFLNQWKADVPNFDATHLVDPTGPDECSQLMNMAFAQAGFQNYMRVPSYFDWLMRSIDFRGVYRFHRSVLQLLQWREPIRRWVLKYPNHILAMTEIRAVCPDAVFVVTHRDPAQTLASLCALTAEYRASRYDSVDRPGIGWEMMEFVGQHLARFMRFRASPGGNDGVIDVDYYRLVADPIATVGEIYDRTDLAMPDSVLRHLRTWTAANPKGKRGVHAYRLADYGLDSGTVNDWFEGYRRRFAIKLENEALK
jgi:hypothetical protein